MKKTLLLISSITITALALLSNINSTDANSVSPNNGTAGAPMDFSGQTCTSCHAGTATTSTATIITSNIPASGYVAGTTYSVSVTMTGAAAYGFEMTPQTAISNVGLGTWIAGAGTSVSTKYIKQSVKKTGASAVWTFSWTAPATATTVTFYGAFNYANNNNTSSGDIIKKSSVTYFASTTGISEKQNDATICIFPNPTTEELHISSSEFLNEGKIYNIEGKISKVISEYELITKTISVLDLPKGIYFLNTTSEEGKTHSLKFIKN